MAENTGDVSGGGTSAGLGDAETGWGRGAGGVSWWGGGWAVLAVAVVLVETVATT